MRRGDDLLAVGPQLLVQLLAGARADDLDRDRRVSGSLPESRIICFARSRMRHRLAHVEHEDPAAPADRAGLDDELRASGIVMK